MQLNKSCAARKACRVMLLCCSVNGRIDRTRGQRQCSSCHELGRHWLPLRGLFCLRKNVVAAVQWRIALCHREPAASRMHRSSTRAPRHLVLCWRWCWPRFSSVASRLNAHAWKPSLARTGTRPTLSPARALARVSIPVPRERTLDRFSGGSASLPSPPRLCCSQYAVTLQRSSASQTARLLGLFVGPLSRIR